MSKIIFLFFFLLSFTAFSQEINIKGTIKDSNDRGIQSASVLLIDDNENNLGYNYSDENGNYSISFAKPNSEKITIEISCLGYQKKVLNLNVKTNTIQNFTLVEKTETLKEVVIDANKKIRIEQDTTTIKVASFGNKTEQTVEDLLKKLPGIEVSKDGTIKAHGKTIDKLGFSLNNIFIIFVL